MVDYLYDGTYDGLLTCIYFHYYNEKASGIYPSSEYQINFTHNNFKVKTESEKAQIVYDAIRKKISFDALERVYSVFLSSCIGKENLILEFLKLGFKVGAEVMYMHSEAAVFQVQQIESKVKFERHRLIGLIRFSDAEGVLFSVVEPDHDVIAILAEHFSDRYKNEKLIIYDKRRKKAVFSYMGKWQVRSFDIGEHPEFQNEELKYRKLWKIYFDQIAIKERINPKCQKRCMPVRYWKHLPEFKQTSQIK